MAVCYLKGESVKEDPIEAQRWLEAAAAQGHQNSCRALRYLQGQQK